jgi:hypothetical protein
MNVFRPILVTCRAKWASRPRIQLSAPLAPTWFLVLLCGFAASAASFFGWTLTRVVPLYFEAASEADAFDALGVALGLALVIVAFFAWAFGEIVAAYRPELRKRLLGL